jgi:hypothetical protein
MRVQLRVERAGGGMHEGRADQVAGDAILSSMPPLRMRVAANCSSSRSAMRGGFLVGLDDAPVIHRDGQNRNDFGRRALEVEEMRRSRNCCGVNCSPVSGCWLSQSLRKASRVTTSPGF